MTQRSGATIAPVEREGMTGMAGDVTATNALGL
jgi:hypothetical protein